MSNPIELPSVSRTVTIVVPTSRERIFSFLSEIENLPKWATEFCQELKRDGAHHKVVTSSGELFFRIESDAKTGVIDMFAGPTPSEQGIFPCRVITLPGQRSAVSFTFFRPADMPEEMYDRQYRSLVIEMDGLAKRFS
jgi:hypothetical protein